MFDRFLKQPHALAVHRNGPLAEERQRFLAHCAEQQMSWDTLRRIASYTLVIAKALRLAKRPGELITRAEIEAAADRWVNRRSRQPRRRKNHRLAVRLFRGHAIRWLTFLERLQPPVTVQQPYADHVAEFTDYMLRERGLSPSTITYSRGTIQGFLVQIDKADLQLKMLTAAEVNELLATKVRNNEYSRVGIRRWAAALRPFFRFAEGRGWCCRGLADAIKTPQMFRHEGLPLGPSWDDVSRLLTQAQGNCPVDIRDRALLLLLAVYGLRAGEVAALRLEDFDWEREMLTVPHGKRRRPRTYPLCRTVGDAVLRYLKKARPRSDRREVFMTVLAPFRPLHSKSVGGMVSRRLHTLGLTLPHYGAHTLRHACATHLLAQGMSLKEIGDHLGHQSPEATRVYAKVDLAALRIVGDFTLEGLL
jgi:site-specific recombinase XerD